MTQDSAFQCEDVRFAYQDSTQQVLRGVNVEIRKGEFVIIAGPSGAGKSTFSRTLNNIIPLFYRGEFSGKRHLSGEVILDQPIASLARKVGMVFQDFEQQLFSTSALLDVAFSMENFGIPRADMQKRVNDLMERFGISHLIGREPFSLSGGEKQKLAIASVMAYRPEILVLDEPTTDLDPDSREFVLHAIPLLKEWVETLIVIDHETDQFTGADRIILFGDGTVTATGGPDQILTDSRLLEANSLAPLDLVRVQEKEGRRPAVLPVADLASTFQQPVLSLLPVPSRSSAEPAMEIQNLEYRYGAHSEPALKDLSLCIRKGEFMGIVGRNGSGKSTLLRHLNGLQLPQQGNVHVLGKEVRSWNRKDLFRNVGLVFQNPDHQIFHATVREEIEFGPLQFGIADDVRKTAVERAMETMDLTAQADRDPFQLSKGERQRVAVASVLSVNPEILILDEPTTGLDHKQQSYLMRLLQELHKQGKTIIIVTHATKLVGEYCDYAILLENGKLAAEGHPRQLFFQNSISFQLPPLWRLSKLLGGNALTAEEFHQCRHR